MKTIDALITVNVEGLDNSQWDVHPYWGDDCRYREMDTVEYAEYVLSAGDYAACAISTYRRQPVKSALLAWREDKDEKTPFMKIEDPMVIVMTGDGAVVEIYSLD